MLYQPELCHVDGLGQSGGAVEPVSQPVSEAAVHHHSHTTPTSRRMAYWVWNESGELGDHVVICVHGLSRQGRDFDCLARSLYPSVPVICVDLAGRGYSDWLADPMAYQVSTYVADMVALMGLLKKQGVRTFAWVGTSLGGLVGMVVASQPDSGIRRLVLNDVGPAVDATALQRIGTYLGMDPRFPTQQAAVAYLRQISATFGPHTPEAWQALSAPMLREVDGEWRLHYDPRIAVPFRVLTAETAQALASHSQLLLWEIYTSICASTLLLRGEESDLLSADVAERMCQTGPKAQCVAFPGVGHAPTLVAPDQVAVVKSFLLAE